MEAYWEWLCSIPGIYRTQQEILLRCFAHPRAVWEASEQELTHLEQHGCSWIGRVRTFRKSAVVEEVVQERQKLGIQFVSHVHQDYPKRLLTLRDRPYGLFYKGMLPPDTPGNVAIVGARQCTPAGKTMAQRLAASVTEAGGCVISGAAYGIDGAAQWEAQKRGGKSYGILGCGVDCCYPASHRRLFEQLAEHGGLISEFSAGTPPKPYHFPMRNRIISGLSDAVIVVEARKRSGALLTADFAAEQGRQVFAVPGRPDDPLSEGCNELIAQGAGILLSPESFVSMFFPDYREDKKPLSDNITLAPAEKLVYSSLGLHTKSLWDLEAHTALSLSDLSDSLLSLERRGLIREVEQNYFAKV